MKPLRVLITNISLDGRTGTETYTRDLALGLRALGHDVTVYSPRIGKLASELIQANVPASNDLSSLAEPDVIHGHHSVPLALAMLRFPNAPAVFVCHDAKAWHDEAPRLTAVQRYVAVDFLCRDRLKADGVPPDRISVIGNSVDLDRFRQRDALPLAAKRALLFSNYANEQTHLRAVREACARAGLQLDVRGYGVGNVCEAPENILGDYDIVFAKARCAMEAMACGAAVVLCGAEGAGALVTSADFETLRDYNFGRHVLKQPLTVEHLLSQIRRYDPADAQAVTRLARKKLDLGRMVQQWIELYGQLQPATNSHDDRDGIARLLATLNSRSYRLAEIEPRLAWLEAAHAQQEEELLGLRKKLRKAVQLRGPVKRFWKFSPTRMALWLAGIRQLDA